MYILNVTDIDQPIESLTPFIGSLALRELYVWPAWYKPKSDILFSYEDKKQPNQIYPVSFQYGKTYTFADLQDIIRKHLNRGSSNPNTANIFYNNKRVTFMINKNLDKNYSVHNIKFCDELLDTLKLPKMDDYTVDVITGNPVDEQDIKLTFNDTDLLYFKCAEIDDSTILENSNNSTLMSIIPLEFSTYNNKLIKFKDIKLLFHPLTQRKTVYNLHFSIEDANKNKLPLHKCVCVVLNK